jgi:hypothetical protein
MIWPVQRAVSRGGVMQANASDYARVKCIVTVADDEHQLSRLCRLNILAQQMLNSARVVLR